jgi:hypothetical protein
VDNRRTVAGHRCGGVSVEIEKESGIKKRNKSRGRLNDIWKKEA